MKLLTNLGLSMLSTIQRDALSPDEGDTIYNYDAKESQTYDGTRWVSMKELRIMDGMRAFVQGSVSTNITLLMSKASIAITYPVNIPLSKIHCLVPPTADVSLEIKRSISPYTVDTTIGTISWITGESVPTVSFSTEVTLTVGDIIKVTTPNDMAGMRDLYIDIIGHSAMPVYEI